MMKKYIFTLALTIKAFLLSAVTLADDIKVACIGDSITYGYGIQDKGNKSYPAQLASILGEEWTVRNFGKNGRTVLKKGHAPYWNTTEYQKALSLNPDVVIIKLGTNDLRTDAKAQNYQHMDEYVSDYVDLINSFKALKSTPTIFICYSVPIYPGNEKVNYSNDITVNELLPKVDEVANLTKVQIIDTHTPLTDSHHLFPDHLHPNAEGARIIADTVAKAITTFFDTSKPK